MMLSIGTTLDNPNIYAKSYHRSKGRRRIQSWGTFTFARSLRCERSSNALIGLEKSRWCVDFKCYSDTEFHDASLRVEEPERQSNKEILESLEVGDLVAIALSSSERLYFEITKKKRSGAVETLCEGEKILLSIANASTADGAHELSTESKGFWPPLSDAWLRSYPGLKAALQELRKSQKQSEELPSQKLLRHSIRGCQKIGSLAQLQRDVMNNPGFWCDGTGPEDRPLTPDETALLSAGELVSLLHEYRGIVLIQLRFSVMESDLVLPLLRPYVLQLLRESCRNKSMAALQSTAADGKVQSLILHSKRQPFKAWSRRLAEIGVQASLVADSPYYKMLIGRMLGYKESNIIHHIESFGGAIDRRILSAVDEELEKLSSEKPHIPWRLKT